MTRKDVKLPVFQMNPLFFYSKHDLAFQLVLEARKQGIQFGWVGADGFYGENPAFLRSLDQINETFMIDVHKDQRIYLGKPRAGSSSEKIK